MLSFLSFILVPVISCSHSRYQGPVSDHYDGKKFFNTYANTDKSISDVIKALWQWEKESWPSYQNNQKFAAPTARLSVDDSRVYFINHSTVLLQLAGKNILLDPIFSERASPFQWIGPQRVRRPGIEMSELPPIDYIFVSHNHYDHFDVKSIQDLVNKDNPMIILPLGNKSILADHGVSTAKCIELDWWQSYQDKSELKWVLTPAQHWSNRGLWDRRESLWGGLFLSAGGKSVYYAGDTGYSPFFAEIRKRLGAPTLSLLPIGAYKPRWFLSPQHIDPEQAVLAHKDLQSRLSVGVHYGTFNLGGEAIDSPKIDLIKAKTQHQVAGDEFIMLHEGEGTRF